MQTIKDHVLERLDLTREVDDKEIMEIIDEEICTYSKNRVMSIPERIKARKNIFFSLRKLDILQELVDDDSITEIMVNGTNYIFFEREGRLFRWDKNFTSKEALDNIVQQIAGTSNRIVNESSPIVDTRLSDGSRVNIVLSPIAIDGTCISIRKFPKTPILMKQLIDNHSISPQAADFLKMLVQAGYNIFISGGTGSGKTTFLNALSEFIPREERVITIEDSAELQLSGIINLVRLETRISKMEGCDEITIRDLIKTALRMRPNRIIVGEIRGAEALDMLQAMNTGHEGSLCTGHSNTSIDMLKRIETMVLMGMELPVKAIRSQIASGIDILIHLGRLRDRSRKVLDISELAWYIDGEIKLNPIFKFTEETVQQGKVAGKWLKTGSLRHREKLAAAGFDINQVNI